MMPQEMIQDLISPFPEESIEDIHSLTPEEMEEMLREEMREDERLLEEIERCGECGHSEHDEELGGRCFALEGYDEKEVGTQVIKACECRKKREGEWRIRV